MHALSCRPFLLILVGLISTGLSAPTPSDEPTTNLTVNANVPGSVLHQPLILPNLNITSVSQDEPHTYPVPDTPITLYFWLGFSLNATSMANTISSAYKYCDLMAEQGGGALPYDEDPFLEDLGYGAEITAVSARPDLRLTWEILKCAMQGLWNYLIIGSHFMEAEFEIKLPEVEDMIIGRGSIGPSSLSAAYSPI